MFIRFLRWLKGYVAFEIKGRFPERFLNICIKYGIFIFDSGPEEGKFYGSLLLSDYRVIRPLAHKARVVLRIKSKRGLPFLLNRYKHRKGLLAGGIVFLVIIIFMQSFVWTVKITPTKTLSETYVRNILRENNLKEGSFKAALNLYAVERKIMEKEQDISWMSINIMGTKAEVEVREKVPVPEIAQADIPCNIKAERDGVILDMNVKQGSTLLTKGSAVTQGQLLISGIIKNSLDELFYVPADGSVIAETTRGLSLEAETKGVYKKPTDIVKRSNLSFFWLRIPLSLSSLEDEYTSRIVSEKVMLNDTFIELGKKTEYCTVYEDTEYDLSDERAEGLLRTEDYLYRLFALKECRNITADISTASQKDKFIMYIKYICVEDITRKEEIIVN